MLVLDKYDFATFTSTQIEMVQQILVRNRPGSNGRRWCVKQLPCTVAAYAVTTRDGDRARLALLDATKVPTVLVPPVEARPVSRWRLLLGSRR